MSRQLISSSKSRKGRVSSASSNSQRIGENQLSSGVAGPPKIIRCVHREVPPKQRYTTRSVMRDLLSVPPTTDVARDNHPDISQRAVISSSAGASSNCSLGPTPKRKIRETPRMSTNPDWIVVSVDTDNGPKKKIMRKSDYLFQQKSSARKGGAVLSKKVVTPSPDGVKRRVEFAKRFVRCAPTLAEQDQKLFSETFDAIVTPIVASTTQDSESADSSDVNKAVKQPGVDNRISNGEVGSFGDGPGLTCAAGARRSECEGTRLYCSDRTAGFVDEDRSIEANDSNDEVFPPVLDNRHLDGEVDALGRDPGPYCAGGSNCVLEHNGPLRSDCFQSKFDKSVNTDASKGVDESDNDSNASFFCSRLSDYGDNYFWDGPSIFDNQSRWSSCAETTTSYRKFIEQFKECDDTRSFYETKKSSWFPEPRFSYLSDEYGLDTNDCKEHVCGEGKLSLLCLNNEIVVL